MNIHEKLASIRVLFRAPTTLALYGIPYAMRADVGQQPGDLWRSTSYADTLSRNYGARISAPGPRADWIFLGYPGGYGIDRMPRDEREVIEAFIAKHRDLVPGNPFEWCNVE